MHFPMCFWNKELVRKEKKKSIDQIKDTAAGILSRDLFEIHKSAQWEKKTSQGHSIP